MNVRHLAAVVLAGLVTASCSFVDDREATTAQGPATTASRDEDGDRGAGADGSTRNQFGLSSTDELPRGWLATTGPAFPSPEDGEGMQPATGDGPVPDPVESLCPTLGPLNGMIDAIAFGTDPAAAKAGVERLSTSLTEGAPSDDASAALISDVRAFLNEANAAMTDLSSPERVRAQFMKVAATNADLLGEYIDAVIGCPGAPVEQMRTVKADLEVQQGLPSSGSPIGRIDALAVVDGRLYLRGWAADRDANGPVKVQVAIDQQVFDIGLTQELGPLETPMLPGFLKGFFTWNPTLSPGPHRICVRVVNVGPGDDSLLGCRSTA